MQLHKKRKRGPFGSQHVVHASMCYLAVCALLSVYDISIKQLASKVYCSTFNTKKAENI